MIDSNDFVDKYFIQTRKEIDTEKRKRDQMLNFVILVIGAFGFAVAQSKATQIFLNRFSISFYRSRANNY